MWLRANVVLVIAVLFALVQMFASATGGPRFGPASAALTTISHNLPGSSTVVRADNGGDNSSSGDNGSSDNSGSSDNGSSDNGSSDNGSSDNSGSDNGSSDNSSSGDNSDNGSSGDNSSSSDADVVIDNVEPSSSSSAAPAATATPTRTTTTSAAPAAPASQPRSNAATSPSPSPQPQTEASAVTTGADQTLSLNGERITVQLFSTLPPGITVTIRMVDPLSYPATPGIRAGDLIFQIEAVDASGAPLTSLPAEANIAVRYTDMDVLGLTEANITMARLDPTTNQWTTAPKLVTDPASNFVAASITDLGVYAVYVP